MYTGDIHASHASHASHAIDTNKSENEMDDSDADAFAVLSLLIITASTFVYFLNH